MFNFKKNVTKQIIDDIALLRDINEKLKIDNSTLEKVKSINL